LICTIYFFFIIANYYQYNFFTDTNNTEFQYQHDIQEEESFKYSGTSKRKTKAPGVRRPYNMRIKQPQNKRETAQKKQNKRTWNRPRIDREASVTADAAWEQLEEIELSAFHKFVGNVPSVEDIMWCGELRTYDNKYTRVSPKKPIQLTRTENEFYYNTTTDDPIIEELAKKPNYKGNVFATASILAHLMSCARALQPWDIFVRKFQTGIFFEKRDESELDFIFVNETANQPPVPSPNQDDFNSVQNLSHEALGINQSFSQQILDRAPKRQMQAPNPFYTEEESNKNPASIAYRYRKFQLGENITLVCRCEVHGETIHKDPKTKKDKSEYFMSYALTEYDPKSQNSLNWRQNLMTQGGALLASEIKNNSCIMSKWAANCVLSGTNSIKLGYVSRINPSNNRGHEILKVDSMTTDDFLRPVNFNLSNAWGIIKFFIEKFQSYENGKYVVMKEPNRPVIKIYRVPSKTFDESSEGEEEEEEENEEKDEEKDENQDDNNEEDKSDDDDGSDESDESDEGGN